MREIWGTMRENLIELIRPEKTDSVNLVEIKKMSSS